MTEYTTEYTNELEIRVFGLRRSGNHAIINWIAAHAPTKVHFFGCASNDGFTPIHTRKGRGDRYGTDIDNIFVKYPKLQKRPITETNKIRNIHKEILMYSYENFDLNILKENEIPKNREQTVGKSKRKIDVLIIRDIFNWFASKITLVNKINYNSMTHPRHERNRKGKTPWFKYYQNWEKDAKQIYGMPYINAEPWINCLNSYINECLGITALLENAIVICYNKWHVNQEYRKMIIERIGWKFTDKGKEAMSSVGGGSSFDLMKFDGKANIMKTNERWKIYEYNKLYWLFMVYFKKTVELSNQVCGDVTNGLFTNKSKELQEFFK